MSMSLNKTQLEYIKRINHVLDFVEKNLDSHLSLKTLSEKAHYSSFHFHRIFAAIVGENLSEFINRKRLERIAAILLVGTDASIKNLAYDYGFSNESSFSRTFKKYYGISPTAFKIKGHTPISKIGIVAIDSQKYFRSVHHLNQWLVMNAQIEVTEREPLQLAGIAHTGAFEEVGTLFQKLMKWAAERNYANTTDFKAITLYHDNPKVTDASKTRFSACITVNQKIKAEGEIRPISIEKGPYAIGNFEIEGKDFPKAWEGMCIWVLENGYDFRDGDYFEVYHNDSSTHPEQKFIVDICIPIKGQKANKATVANNKQPPCRAISPATNGETKTNYHELIKHMKELRRYFEKTYGIEFSLGKVYQGHKDFSYFSLSTKELKRQKLKFVIILDHVQMHFRISLSGQNKAIRKKYWNLFKNSDWEKYPLVTSIDNSLSIMEHTLLKQPDFSNMTVLCKHIESEALRFIEALKAVLE